MKKLIVSVIAVGVMAVGAVYLHKHAPWDQKPSANAGGFGNMPTPQVEYIVTEGKTVPLPYEYPAMIEASRVTEVRARVKGYLSERLFEEGALVKEGDVLYRIERDSFEADVEVGEARVQQAEAQLRYAEREATRLKSLGEAGVIAQGDLDRSLAEWDVAKASVRLEQSSLAKSKLELSYTEIRSPLTGIAGKTVRDAGALVDTGENSLLTTITQIDPVYASFGISQKEYLRWKDESASGEIVLAGGKRNFEVVREDNTTVAKDGKLNFEAPDYDPETGTMQMRIEFENLDHRMKPGQFIRLRVLGIERPNSIVVPQKAVAQSPAGASVMVIGEGNKVMPQSVTLGPWIGEGWLIDKGLQPGQRIIVEGLMKAWPGSVVDPVLHDPNAPPPDKAAPPASEHAEAVAPAPEKK